MGNLGMDFGTTNSSVYYFDKQKNDFWFLTIGNQRLEFFPTMIAYGKEDNTKLIGESAKLYQFSPKMDVYNHFKLSLGRNAKECNGREKAPYDIAKDFFKEVLSEYCQKTGMEIDKIVLTVPDIWKNEITKKTATENLLEMFSELGYSYEQIRFESEPVAAAAYYCKMLNNCYQGYVVVVDFGGGTLDLTLCKVDENSDITVMRRCGNSGDYNGCAGIAFDEALAERIIKKYNLNIKNGSKEFYNLFNAIESAKINSVGTDSVLRDAYAGYDQYSGCFLDDKLAFSVPDSRFVGEEYDVMASDIIEVFDEVNKPALTENLQRMKEYCKELNIDINQQDNFRILMVGGFSNLYCVEACCREEFDSLPGIKDERFDDKMHLGNRCSTAIANGAAIIAEGMTKVNYLCQTDVGYYYYDVESADEKYATVIQKDAPVSDYSEPVFSNLILQNMFIGSEIRIKLFFDDGYGKIPVYLDESFKALCPDFDNINNSYQLGFSMNRQRIPILHIRDKNGKENTHSLNSLIEKIAIRKVDTK